MSKFLKENLWLLITFSLAMMTGNLIYRFYLVPRAAPGEVAEFMFEVSILPVIFALLFWGARADSWRKLLSFAFIISVLSWGYLELTHRLGFIGTEYIENDARGFLGILWGMLTATGFFYMVLGIIRIIFLGIRFFFREILPDKT